MTLPRDLLAAHREEILALAEKYGIASVKVFGSVARKEDTEKSDIDLLIDLVRPVRSGLDFIRFQQATSDLLGLPIDVMFENGVFQPMRERVLKEARPL